MKRGLGSVGIGILWLSLFSCEVLDSVQLDRAAALSSVVLGFHGMLEYWLKLQVCWWTYLALTLDVSLLGVQRACIATDATIGCWMVCFENARLEAKTLAL